MDTFDLKWPQTDATLYTDGWRCRIVWREKRGGLGGTIENHDQVKQRVANSLLTAPYLLGALRARGHGLLAEEIAAMADDDLLQETQQATPTAAKSAAAEKTTPALEAAPTPKSAPKQAKPTPSGADQIGTWLSRLEGSSDFEAVDSRRAKVWQPCAELADESLLLKAPAPKGKREWVLKRTFADARRKAEYVAAPDLRGICCYLHERGLFTHAGALENWLTQVEGLQHEALAQAASIWREVSSSATH